jgi:glycosyltransferase involved in cell wall biosynthesis
MAPHVLLSLAATDQGRSGLSTYVRGLYRTALQHDLVGRLTLLGTARDLATSGLLATESGDGDRRVRTVRLPDSLEGRTASTAFHLFGLPRVVARVKPDVVHLPVGNRRPGRSGRAPVVTTVHDVGGEQSGSRSYGLARRLYSGWVVPRGLRAADRIVVISEATRGALAAIDPALSSRSVVVPNGVDLARFHPAPREDAWRDGAARVGVEPPYVLYSARLEHPSKNHLTLIRAFLAARRRRSLGHKLVLVGAEWQGADVILDAVRQSEGAVHYAGFVPEDVVPPLVQGADLVAFPSLFEGFGLPALEAMACGVPLVASAEPPIGDVVGDGGLVVDCRDEGTLAAALERGLLDESLRRRLRVAGPRRAAHFGWEACARRTFAVLADAVADRPGRTRRRED